MLFSQKKKKTKNLLRILIRLRQNIHNNKKLLKFKKKKWEKFLRYANSKLKRYKKYKTFDQNTFLVSKFANKWTSLKKSFKNTLITSQIIRLFYGNIDKKQLKYQIKLSKKTSTKFKNTELLKKFEERLDTILFRAKFCKSIKTAKQMISHGKIKVNDRLIKTKSFKLKKGDIISVKKDEFMNIERNILRSKIWPLPPKYLTINYKTMKIIIGDINKNFNLATMFSFNLNVEKIVENFSKQ